ncbi:hypothetical protein [Cognataquiflexum rubidum]|nr:hypothetical protein [Cognataquiflexum rubidum]MCH6233274.1 hypothetical protein [Cognataquiflexum rubidum]
MPVDKIAILILVCGLKCPVHPCPTTGGGLRSSVLTEEEFRVTGKKADN